MSILIYLLTTLFFVGGLWKIVSYKYPVIDLEFTNGTQIYLEVINTHRDPKIRWNMCADVTWELNQIQTVYLEGKGVTGFGNQTICEYERKANFEITYLDGVSQRFELDYASHALPMFVQSILFAFTAYILQKQSISLGKQAITPKTYEILPLTSIRAFAATLVFFVHIASGNSIFYEISRYGFIGIHMFFVLSGFLITLRYYDTFQEINIHILNDYIIKRIARVYPLYLFLFVFLVPTHSDIINWMGFSYMTLQHVLFEPITTTNIFPVAWTLSIEIHFYLLAPLLFFLLHLGDKQGASNWANITRITFILILFNLILFQIGSILSTLFQGNHLGFLPNVMYLQQTIFGRLSDFSVGILIAIIYQRTEFNFLKSHRLLSQILAIFTVTLFLFILPVLYFTNLVIPISSLYLATSVVTITGLMIIVILMSIKWINIPLSLNVFVYFGYISYALYLIQGTTLLSPANNIALISGFTEKTTIKGIIVFIYAIPISIALYEWIEKPVQKYIAKKIPKAASETISLPQPRQ